MAKDFNYTGGFSGILERVVGKRKED